MRYDTRPRAPLPTANTPAYVIIGGQGVRRMTLDALQRKLTELNVWKRGDERAPHKPLLLLLAIGRAARGEDRLVSFREIEEPLTGLLRHFGPPRHSYHPEFPFRYLVTDGLWEVPDAASVSSWGKKHLRDRGVEGGMPQTLHRLLADDPPSARLAARRLVDEHFPASMHQHILEAVGLWGVAEAEDTVPQRSRRPRRDPHFREAVLTAYERRCAVCDFDLRLKDDLLGLEAAHIQWHSHGGPDQLANGLALCTFHHGAFDRGAIGLGEDEDGSGWRLLVSREVHGTSPAVRWLLDYHDRPIRPPQEGLREPAGQYVAWHTKQVFRAPPRGRSSAAAVSGVVP